MRILGRTPVDNIIDENNVTIVKAGEIISEQHLDLISKLGIRSLLKAFREIPTILMMNVVKV